MKKEEILAKSRKEKKDERKKIEGRNKDYYGLVAADILLTILTIIDISFSEAGKSILGYIIEPMICVEIFGALLYSFMHNGKKITTLVWALVFLTLTIYFTWSFVQNAY